LRNGERTIMPGKVKKTKKNMNTRSTDPAKFQRTFKYMNTQKGRTTRYKPPRARYRRETSMGV
jgi:hypothetical protein